MPTLRDRHALQVLNTAVKCFAGNYNYSHFDSKRGTNGHIERLGKKFGGKMLHYGCKIRYLPHGGREVELREKLEPSLRDGIFVGYRSHSGGRWAEQYEAIDWEAYSKITIGTGRRAHVHAVSEIYVPGSAGNDSEQHPAFPAADGRLEEAENNDDEESSEDTVVNTVEDPTTNLEETLLSSQRAEYHEDPDPQNAGGVDGRDTEGVENELRAGVSDQDSWHIDGGYVVRRHQKASDHSVLPTRLSRRSAVN